MWIYYQNNGLLIRGAMTLHCYAGIEDGKNNPAMQGEKNVGPIPVGRYTALSPHDDPKHGPFAMHLIPFEDNEMHGRDGFMYHADSIAHPGHASNGCIISMGSPAASGRSERELFWNSGDHIIEVISGVAE